MCVCVELYLCVVVWVWCGSQEKAVGWEGMENVSSGMVCLEQTCRPMADGHMFLLLMWRAAAISLDVRVYSPLPAILPSVSSPPSTLSPDQLYQHDKILRNTGVTSLLSFLPCSQYPHLTEAFTFSLGCWESHHRHFLCISYLQTLHAMSPQISLPQVKSSLLVC